VIAVNGSQFALVYRGRRYEDYTEIVAVGDMWVREDVVEVGSERFERDVLLWAAWGVWKAGVVGALAGEGFVSRCSVLLFRIVLESLHTEEDGE
jgi:hypothetical protein